MKIDNASKITVAPRRPVSMSGQTYYPGETFEITDEWDMLHFSPADPRKYCYIKVDKRKGAGDTEYYASNEKVWIKVDDLKTAKKDSGYDDVVKNWDNEVKRLAEEHAKEKSDAAGAMLSAVAAMTDEQKESLRQMLDRDKKGKGNPLS